MWRSGQLVGPGSFHDVGPSIRTLLLALCAEPSQLCCVRVCLHAWVSVCECGWVNVHTCVGWKTTLDIGPVEDMALCCYCVCSLAGL